MITIAQNPMQEFTWVILYLITIKILFNLVTSCTPIMEIIQEIMKMCSSEKIKYLRFKL